MKTSKRFYLLMVAVFVITTVFFSSCSKDDEETPKKPDTAVDTPVTPPAPSGDTDEPEPSTPAGTGLGQGVKERIEIYLEGDAEKWTVGGDFTGFTGDANMWVYPDDYICNQSGDNITLLDMGVDVFGKVNYPFIVSLKDKGTLYLSFYMSIINHDDWATAGDVTLTVKGYTGDVETNSYTRTFTPYETLTLLFYANRKIVDNKQSIFNELTGEITR